MTRYPVGRSRAPADERLLGTPVLDDLVPPVAPAMTAHVAITGMSVSGCNLFAVPIRGSGTSANTVVNGKGLGYPPVALGVAVIPQPVSGS